jgi:hypothetical protein
MAIANTLGAGLRLAVVHPMITSGIVGGLIGAGWGAYNYGWRGAIGYCYSRICRIFALLGIIAIFKHYISE